MSSSLDQPPSPTNGESTSPVDNEELIVAQPVTLVDLVRATQYGRFDELVEYLQTTSYNVNDRDHEDVSLLHWAAINDRDAIVDFLLSKGADINAIGGSLESTPLHWACRQGHLTMVVKLVRMGANTSIFDIEGCNPLHVAAQLGHTPIVAYLVAKGTDIDEPDASGKTALMWCACKVLNIDPTRLLISLGASVTKTDSINKNTALHWAVSTMNITAITLLLKSGASVETLNSNNETPIDIARKNQSGWCTKKLESHKKAPRKNTLLGKLTSNGLLIDVAIYSIPFTIYFLAACIVDYASGFALKLIGLILIGIVIVSLSRNLFHARHGKHLLVFIYIAITFWLNFTMLKFYHQIYQDPFVASLILLFFSLQLYSFLKCWTSDPGRAEANKDHKLDTIIELAEEKKVFDPKYFCSTCLIKKPLRSKHCVHCDRCIARFDHYCPWIGNCIGYKNHKYFLWFVTSVIVNLGIFIQQTYIYCAASVPEKEREEYASESWILVFFQAIANGFKMSGFVTLGAVLSTTLFIWSISLLCNQAYLLFWKGMTTNESMNAHRYDYFRHTEKGRVLSAFNRGCCHNFVDFCELRFMRHVMNTDIKDWRSTYPHYNKERITVKIDQLDDKIDKV